MVKVVGIRFKSVGKIYYFDPGAFDLKEGENAIVETARGIEFGQVVIPPKEVSESEIVSPLKKVLRIATEQDIKQVETNREKENEAFRLCNEKINCHNLEMNLVDVEYTFDNSKVIFYFTADGRIDFRELVKDLASVFKTRIELRQIGVRDEAKMLGGIGPCGRVVCCKEFLSEFQPVSIRMAKEQNLSLNPSKISGLCGRLMCCLRYECDHYEDAKAFYPEEGSRVITLQGEGKVVSINVMKNTVYVELDNKQVMEFPPEEIEVKDANRNNDGSKRRTDTMPNSHR